VPPRVIEEILKGKAVEINETELDNILDKVIMGNVKAVEDLKAGKEQSLMFLIGQVIKALGKKVDANLIKEKIKGKIK